MAMSKSPFLKSHKEIVGDYFNQAVEELANKFSPKTAADAANFALILTGLDILDKEQKRRESEKQDDSPVFLGSFELTEPISSKELPAYIVKAREKLDAVDNHYNMAEYSIAYDTLKHAEHYIEKAKSKAISKEERDAVCDLKTRHSLMAQALGEKGF